MQANRLNLRHLRVFLAVHDHGSLAMAAELVHLSQPAMTQAIGGLETRFGVVLFHRSRRGMAPTAAATLLAGRTARALDLLREGCMTAARRGRSERDGAFDTAITSTQLRALIAVAAQGSFAVAARAEGVAQPTLYRVARDLETATGLRLFERARTGVTLTEAARTLVRAARLAFAELAQGIEEAAQSKGYLGASIVIGSLPLARSSLLPAAITAFTAQRPDVAIQVVDGPYSDLLHALREGEIDLMIGALRDPLPADDVVQQVLFQDRLGVYCGPDHPLAGQGRVRIEDIASYPWVLPRVGTPTRSHFDKVLRDHGMTMQSPPIESSSLVLIRGVLAGSGRLTVMSRQQVREDVRRGGLVALPVALGDAGRPIGITLREGWQPTTTQSLFLDLLRGVAENPPPR